jgi:hypothetical protein
MENNKKSNNFRLVRQLFLVMIATSLVTIIGSATLNNYLSGPITENINISAPLSLEHSNDGITWTNNPITFDGHSGDTIAFDVRLINHGQSDIPAVITAKITCSEGLTKNDFQDISATYGDTTIPIKELFTEYNSTILILSYEVTVGSGETYLAGISMTLATNAVGHYKVTNQVSPT